MLLNPDSVPGDLLRVQSDPSGEVGVGRSRRVIQRMARQRGSEQTRMGVLSTTSRWQLSVAVLAQNGC